VPVSCARSLSRGRSGLTGSAGSATESQAAGAFVTDTVSVRINEAVLLGSLPLATPLDPVIDAISVFVAECSVRRNVSFLPLAIRGGVLGLGLE
jgi:5-enolpyruvylshikimate-3-phosphate synthase